MGKGFSNKQSDQDKQIYLNLLNKLLKAASIDSSQKKIYQILVSNRKKLDDRFARVLRHWSKNTLSNQTFAQKQQTAICLLAISSVLINFRKSNYANFLEIEIAIYEAALTVPQYPKIWSMTKFLLATAYSDRYLGDRSDNIEQAILLYQEGLQKCDRATSAFDWGKTQYNLGRNYLKRIKGDKTKNIEIGIYYLKQALQVYSLNTLPQEWADAQSMLGDAYWERLQGTKADNIEEAIECFQQALLVNTIELRPEKWAKIQDRLAFAYYDRVQGNKADNIELAIHHCQQELLVRKRELYPEEWATIQHNLALAYYQRILGEKFENIEQAIIFLEEALKVRNLQYFPEKWADSQSNYGSCYLHRIQGNKADNIEQAIYHFTEALRVYSRESFPQHWAGLQIDMASAYLNRIRGKKAENIERVIFFCTQALQIYTREDFPQHWASAQFNLASGYIYRLEGEIADNIEQAICCLKKVLLVRTHDLDPEGWATAKISLGMAYQERIRGEPEENIDLSIKYLREALSVCTRSNLPLEWAKAHHILGASYLNRQKDNSVENIEQAIYYFTEALSILTTANFPHDWASAHHNLGTIYADRLRGKSEENLEKSIQHYTKALQVFTPKAFPEQCLMSGFLMAHLAFDYQLWDRVIIGCEAAINASEILRSWETSESIRQKIHDGTTQIGLYQAIVKACINIGQIGKALEYVERSRSKRLVDLMASNDLYGDGEIPQAVRELLQQYESLQQQIDNLRSQNDSQSDRGILNTNNRTRAALELDRATLSSLEAQKQEIWQQMRQLDPVLAGEIQVSAPNISQMQQLIDRPTTAILSFFTTDKDTHVFVLHQERITLHTCVGQGIETLQVWLREEWLIPYRKDNSQWSDRLNYTLAELAQRLQIDELIKGHLDGIEELIIIPHLLLHQIPFAAIPIEKDFYLGDRLLIRYIPSCQVLEFCQQRQEIEAIAYGTVEDAEENLAYASFEGEQIAQLYQIPRQQRLQGSQEATCKNYRQLIERVQFIHCCHHAESRLDNPLESRLKLADGSITLGQLMTPGWRLPDLSDVFLSCCETGLGEPSLSDDLFTLSTGFLCAGARTVVSTLWSVDDLATALFSIFYYQQLQQVQDRSLALQQAGVRLRQLKKEDLIAIATPIKSRAEELRKERKKYLPGSAERSRYDYQYKTYGIIASGIFNILNAAEQLPFSHPRYWAAFICQGNSTPPWRGACHREKQTSCMSKYYSFWG
jgi:CHAT domain-containing protein